VQAPAAALPFPDASIDHLFSAQTLQFVGDRSDAVREIARVLRPGGRAAISLWLPQRSNPYNSTVIDVIGRHLGRDVAAALAAAFSLGDPSAIVKYLRDEGMRDVVVEPHEMVLPLPPLREFVPSHIAGTPMSGPFSSAAPHVRETIVREIIETLQPYGDPARIPFRAHFIRATR
jgi:SAM-dependent methyltransferase